MPEVPMPIRPVRRWAWPRHAALAEDALAAVNSAEAEVPLAYLSYASLSARVVLDPISQCLVRDASGEITSRKIINFPDGLRERLALGAVALQADENILHALNTAREIKASTEADVTADVFLTAHGAVIARVDLHDRLHGSRDAEILHPDGLSKLALMVAARAASNHEALRRAAALAGLAEIASSQLEYRLPQSAEHIHFRDPDFSALA